MTQQRRKPAKWLINTVGAAGLAAILYASTEAQQPAIEFTDTGILANDIRHWRHWIYQNNFVSSLSVPIDSSGLFDIATGIKPRYFPGKKNYVLDRAQFSYVDNVRFDGQEVRGQITALSNPHLATNAGDGDPTTFWEPDATHFSPEGLRHWQIEIDLGRTVWADSIVVIFPPPSALKEPGDPFKLFVIEVSMGQSETSFTRTGAFLFATVGRATPEGGQRRYVFPLEPLGKADFDLDNHPDMPGTFMHLVRLTVFDSAFDQKEFLGEGEAGRTAYEALLPERHGQRVFHRVTLGGGRKRVAEDLYYQLPLADRGPIHYYLRELPRLGEIEVWGPGPNLAYLPQRRAGGGYEDGGRGTPLATTDGLFTTKWIGSRFDPKQSSNYAGRDQHICCTMWLDLGAVFWTDTIYLGSLGQQRFGGFVEGPPTGYHILGSDGTNLKPLSMHKEDDFPQLEVSLVWSDLVSELHKDNTVSSSLMMRETFAPRRLRFFELRNIPGNGSGFFSAFFSEFQMYGRGYPAAVSFVSPPIVLLPGVGEEDAAQVKERRALTRIAWETEAVVRRTDPFTGASTEVSEALALHPEVDLQIQTRTSDTVDSLLTYYELIGRGTAGEKRVEVDGERFQELTELWILYEAWNVLPESRILSLRPHQTGRDDDGDTRLDEDPIDGLDNDGDRLIDEDGVDGEVGGPNARGTITLLKHQRKRDDDGDGAEDEDPIDGLDNDGDRLIDEDGKKIPKPRQENQVITSPYFAGWSGWSSPYRPSAGLPQARITSPSPRKFLQVRVNIVSADPDVTARLHSLRIGLAPPISTDAVGELAVRRGPSVVRTLRDLTVDPLDYGPPEDIPPLADQPFSFFIRAAGPDPLVSQAASGFDEVLLVAPFPARLQGVRLGQVASSGQNPSQKRAHTTRFTRAFASSAGDSLLRDEEGRPLFTWTSAAGDSLLLRFAEAANLGFGEEVHALIEVQFATRVIRAGTQLMAFVRSSRDPATLSQRVDTESQDATELVDSNTAIPLPLFSDKLIDGVAVDPVVTPNGDGVNDELAIRFTVLRLLDDRPVAANIYDLSGRFIARARSASGHRQTRSGPVRFVWDGRGEDGALVLPGIYLCRIQVQADQKTARAVRIVHVAY